MRRQPSAKPVAEPIDWPEIAGSLDERGYAITPSLLTRGECREIAALYPREEVFRSRVIMQRHAFGRGEYQYFRYPLPSVVERLRQTIYPHLAGGCHCARDTDTAIRDAGFQTSARSGSRSSPAGSCRPTRTYWVRR